MTKSEWITIANQIYNNLDRDEEWAYYAPLIELLGKLLIGIEERI